MWTFKNQIFDNTIEEFDSFVYLIERLNIEKNDCSPKLYIGKKTFFNKSKYKNKRIIIESDWWDYYGSSEWLQEDIEKYGKSNFRRTILHLCRTKGDAGYLETFEQMKRNVLSVSNGYKLYYNKTILGRYRYEPTFYNIENNISDYYNIEEKNPTKKWITNSKENRLVSNKIAEELVSASKWCYGKTEKETTIIEKIIPTKDKTPKKIKQAVFKNNKLKWIFDYELKTHLTDGWMLQSTTTLYSATNYVEQKIFNTEHELHEFLNTHVNWMHGKITKNSFISGNVLAKDIRTNEKLSVNKEELKENKYLVPVSTKQIKIKKKNRIIFKGYLQLFLLNNPTYPKTSLMQALKTGNIASSKKLKTLANEKITVVYI